MNSVFLSYTRQSEDLARSLAKAMEELGVKVVDPAVEIGPGDNWKDSITNAIRNADAMVLVMEKEPNSVGVSFETGVAEALEKPILIVHPDSIDPMRLPRWMRSRQMLSVKPSHIDNTAKDLAEALV
jgi:3-hydroxyisobutyrate dehydrogenase-like beta-hydroxyacid dehydrogenase